DGAGPAEWSAVPIEPPPVAADDTVRTGLRTMWHLPPDGCTRLSRGMASATWKVLAGGRTSVVKLVPPTASANSEARTWTVYRGETGRARGDRWARSGRGLGAQVVEDERVDLARRDALLQVLDPGPVGQGRVQLVLNVAAPGQQGAYLVGQRAAQLQQGVRI